MQTEEAKSKFPIFSRRFNELRGKMSQADFAVFLEISRPTVGFYENGDRLPDALTLKKIAEKCGVPSDWLIGLTDNKKPENIDIGCQLGFSDKAISHIKLNKESFGNEVLSLMLENKIFYMLVEEISSSLVAYKQLIEELKTGLTEENIENQIRLRKEVKDLLGNGAELLVSSEAGVFHTTRAQYMTGQLIDDLCEWPELNGSYPDIELGDRVIVKCSDELVAVQKCKEAPDNGKRS